jgi:hypothetical protein
MRRLFMSTALAYLSIVLLPTNGSRSAPPKEPAHQGNPLSLWISQLKSRDVQERADAAETLGKMGRKAGAAAPALVQTLKDQNRPRPSGTPA